MGKVALKKNKGWNIAAYHQAEMNIAENSIFGKCSHLFSNEEFNKYAALLHTKILQMDIAAKFAVGTYWGMDVDDKTGEVWEVYPNTQASHQGVQAGDHIVGVDGREINFRELQWLMHVMMEFRPFPEFPFNGEVNFRSLRKV